MPTDRPSFIGYQTLQTWPHRHLLQVNHQLAYWYHALSNISLTATEKTHLSTGRGLKYHKDVRHRIHRRYRTEVRTKKNNTALFSLVSVQVSALSHRGTNTTEIATSGTRLLATASDFGTPIELQWLVAGHLSVVVFIIEAPTAACVTPWRYTRVRTEYETHADPV